MRHTVLCAFWQQFWFWQLFSYVEREAEVLEHIHVQRSLQSVVPSTSTAFFNTNTLHILVT